MPDHLANQRRVLERLLIWCEEDPGVRYLTIGCSLERGNTDAFSDLDTLIGVRAGSVEGTLQRLRAALPTFGDLIETYDHDWTPLPNHTFRHFFVQYADRTQLDLGVVADDPCYVPRVIVLYDPESVVVVVDEAVLDPKPDEVRLWACEAWVALANVGKYLRRSSFWEAERELAVARTNLFRLWAQAEGVPQARYGVAAVFDTDEKTLPPDVEKSLPGTSQGDVLAAARYITGQLLDLQERLRQEKGYDLPLRFGSFVRREFDEGKAWLRFSSATLGQLGTSDESPLEHQPLSSSKQSPKR